MSNRFCDNHGMKRKLEFVDAVQGLVPNEPFIQQAAQVVPEEMLPEPPLNAAREFVGIIRKWRQSHCLATNGPLFGDSRLKTRPDQPLSRPEKCCQKSMNNGSSRIRLRYAMRVKSAEFWIRLGEPGQALLELQHLPEEIKQNPWVVKVMVSAAGAASRWQQLPPTADVPAPEAATAANEVTPETGRSPSIPTQVTSAAD